MPSIPLSETISFLIWTPSASFGEFLSYNRMCAWKLPEWLKFSVYNNQPHYTDRMGYSFWTKALSLICSLVCSRRNVSSFIRKLLYEVQLTWISSERLIILQFIWHLKQTDSTHFISAQYQDLQLQNGNKIFSRLYFTPRKFTWRQSDISTHVGPASSNLWKSSTDKFEVATVKNCYTYIETSNKERSYNTILSERKYHIDLSHC